MRIVLVGLVSLLTLLGVSRAQAQWMPNGPYEFTQGQTYDLFFSQPALDEFLALDMYVRYPSAVFEPVSLLPGSPGVAGLLDVSASPPTPMGGGGMREVYVTATPIEPDIYGNDLPAGSLFGVRFQVKGTAPLGLVNVPTNFEFTFGDPAHVSLGETMVPGSASIPSNIVAVPEPAAWAMMLAGLGLVTAGALRARRRF